MLRLVLLAQVSVTSPLKGKSLIEKFDSVYPIRDSDGNIQMSTLNCSHLTSMTVFPNLIFDNAQSTTFIKALLSL